MRPDAGLDDEYSAYVQAYAETSGTTSGGLYLDVHRGHMVFLKPGEARFATENALARTLTGSGPEIIGQLEVMESAGIDNIVVSVPNAQGARDLIQDFSREVIAKRG